jgi:hypothetical protein
MLRSYVVEKVPELSGALALFVHIASDPDTGITNLDTSCRRTCLALAFLRYNPFPLALRSVSVICCTGRSASRPVRIW